MRGISPETSETIRASFKDLLMCSWQTDCDNNMGGFGAQITGDYVKQPHGCGACFSGNYCY